jgi:Mrp family chromosome partitioning ATPase
MARILEAFRQVESKRIPQAESAPAPHTTSSDWGHEDEDATVPFVEVGGPAGSVAYSSDTRPGRPGDPRPGAPRNGKFIPADEPVALAPPLGEKVVAQISFRPLPATAPPPRPACERLAEELVAFHQPEHAVSEQYRGLLAGIEAQLASPPPHVVLLTGLAPGTGTTTVLLNLALTRSVQGLARVAVLDANLSSPAVAQRLGLPLSPGLREVLEGSVSPQRALRDTGVHQLRALTAGKGSDADLPIPHGDRMRTLLEQLRGRFDWTFVDAPSWDGRPELANLSTLCDAVYLVIPENAGELAEVKELVQTIPQQGGRLRGCIFTQR